MDKSLIQTAPYFFRDDRNPAYLANMFAGQSIFLLCGGPSLASTDWARLRDAQVMSCAVNNAAVLYRPDIWVSVDSAGNFCESIWREPRILKFIPEARFNDRLRTRTTAGRLVETDARPATMPAVFGFRLKDGLDRANFLREPQMCWGDHWPSDVPTRPKTRSVMLVALKVLFVLGFRRVFLLGCDFRMRYGESNYAFPQERTRRIVRHNNQTYRVLNDWLSWLRTEFEREQFEVYNCTPRSGLHAFPCLSFQAALELAPPQLGDSNTLGMYDQRSRDGSGMSSRHESKG